MSKDGDNSLFGDFSFDMPELEINPQGGEQTSTEPKQEETVVEKKETEENQPATTDEPNPNEERLVDTDLFEKTTSSNETVNEDPSSTTDDDSSGSSSSPLSSGLLTALGAEGFINVSEEELEGVEDVAQFLRDKLNEAVNEKVKGGLTEKQVKALEAFEKGVPIENYVNSNAREQSYQQITNEIIEQREDYQIELVRRMLVQTGFSEEDAKDTIATYREVGGNKLVTKAIEARDKLVRFEQAYKQQLEEQAEAQMRTLEEQREAKLKSTQDYINSQSEIIENLPLSDKNKDDLYKVMTTPVDEVDGQKVNAIGKRRSEDPTRFDMLMAYYYNLGLFDEKPDVSKIKKMAETKAASGLDTLLKEGTGFIKSGGGSSPKKGADGNFDSALDNFLG